MPSGNSNGNGRNSISGLSGVNPALDKWSGTQYLFPGAEDKSLGHLKELERLSTPDIKSYIKLTEPDDKFPTLSRRGGSNVLSANPDAHDLANPRVHGNEPYAHHSRNRSSHQSMPHNVITYGQPANSNEENGNYVHARHGTRHSISSNLAFHDDRHDEAATPVPSSRPTALQSSYSTNDLPTVKGNGNTNGNGHAITPPKSHHEQMHQHNTSLGRIPQGVANNRPVNNEVDESEMNGNHQSQTTLQASAPPFGPQLTPAASNNHVPGAIAQMTLPFQVPATPAFGYGMQPYVNQVTPINGHMQNFAGSNGYNGYPNYGTNTGFRYNEPTVRGNMAQRRQDTDTSQLTRFGNFPLEHYKGELYSLCKDQHGCRYLQRKLEERNEEHVQLIFNETHMHVIELMTGMESLSPLFYLVLITDIFPFNRSIW